MKEVLSIKNLSFSYNKKRILKDLNLNVKKGDFITILGASKSGKTTLVKILSNKLKYEGVINIKSKKIGIFLEDENFKEEIVMNEFLYTLRKQKLTKQEKEEKIKELTSYLNINYLLNYSTKYLSVGQEQLVKIIRLLIQDFQIIILDDAFTMIDYATKKKLFKYLKKINKGKKITIINISSDSEESIYGKSISIINNGTLINHDKTEKLLQKEKIFKKNNLKLPFMAELSIKLQYYELIEGIILDMNTMVKKLWK